MLRQLLPEDRKLLDEIYSIEKKPSFISIFKASKPLDDKYLLIDDIAGAGAISDLVPLVFHSETKVRSKAAEKVHQLFITVDDNNLSWLDCSIRSYYGYYNSKDARNRWGLLIPENIQKLELPNAVLSSVLSVLCSHHNGRVREASLLRLSSLDSRAAVRIAFIRLNDWAEQVRATALTTLIKQLPTLSEEQLVECLLLTNQLKTRGRQDHSRIIADIEHRFNTKDGAKALLKAIHHSDYHTARASFNLAKKCSHVDKSHLLDFGLTHNDILVRSSSLSMALEQLRGDDLLAYLLLASKDKLPSLSKKALYVLIEKFPAQSVDTLQRCLTSDNYGLRDTAIFYLGRHHSIDVADTYREKLTSAKDNELYSIIMGLAESGIETDWTLISPYENSHRPKVKAAVIRASERLSQPSTEWLLGKIDHGCPAEVSAAKTVMLSTDNYRLEEVEQAHLNANSEISSRTLRQLTMKRNPWFGAKLLLHAINSTPLEKGLLPKALHSELTNWLRRNNRSYWFMKPDAALLEELLESSKVAASIHPTYEPAQTIKAVIIRLDALEI